MKYPRELLVADTGPLITLERIPDGFAYFRKFVGKLLVPEKVMEEYLKRLQVPPEAYEGFIEVVRVEPEDVLEFEKKSLSPADIDAISLAYKLQTTLLLWEAEAMKSAQQKNVPVTNIANEFMNACVAGYISYDEARARIQQLSTFGRIDELFVRRLLQELRFRYRRR